ncbi:hypothetical protein H2202_010972 [Exophiala xenobiotica]|nr:hypothetical protein H2202_010972 [Exophiala xenobiotica]
MVEAFAGAVQQFVRGPRKAVDLFTCLAPPIDPLTNFNVILQRFFSIATKMGVAPAVVFDFIASAMLVQAYQKQSHRGLCEECIRDYYPADIAPYTYCVGICEFCGVDALSVFSCKPVTVEPNIAAIDGGGVRGVVALVLLKRLQAALDTGQPIWEYFDSFIGTNVGYAILRPLQPSAEPYLWEIARSTAAAPGYFRPKEIAPFGALQDGGIRANNPTDAALWELNCIWPESNGPHLVLSVGTGCQKPVSHELGPYRGVWLDGFIPRILRAFLSSPSLDAESSWMALWNRLDANTREHYHRLSCEFDGELPDLDDSSQIPRLIHMTKSSTVDYDTLKCKFQLSEAYGVVYGKAAETWQVIPVETGISMLCKRAKKGEGKFGQR